MKNSAVTKKGQAVDLIEQRKQLSAAMPSLRDSFEIFQQQYIQYLKQSQGVKAVTGSGCGIAVLRKTYRAE